MELCKCCLKPNVMPAASAVGGLGVRAILLHGIARPSSRNCTCALAFFRRGRVGRNINWFQPRRNVTNNLFWGEYIIRRPAVAGRCRAVCRGWFHKDGRRGPAIWWAARWNPASLRPFLLLPGRGAEMNSSYIWWVASQSCFGPSRFLMRQDARCSEYCLSSQQDQDPP